MSLPIIIAIVLSLAVAIILALVASKPNSFRLQRSAIIKAPASKIYPLIEDFHAWGAWSPWEKMEAAGDLQKTYGGAPSGKGATYSWTGKKTGTGAMAIVEADAPSKVLITLDFIKPFEAHNMAEFTLAPEGDATLVTWAMYGPQPFMAKLMGLVFNSEKMVGPSFEQGLADLKAAAEA